MVDGRYLGRCLYLVLARYIDSMKLAEEQTSPYLAVSSLKEPDLDLAEDSTSSK